MLQKCKSRLNIGLLSTALKLLRFILERRRLRDMVGFMIKAAKANKKRSNRA